MYMYMYVQLYLWPPETAQSAGALLWLLSSVEYDPPQTRVPEGGREGGREGEGQEGERKGKTGEEEEGGRGIGKGRGGGGSKSIYNYRLSDGLLHK